MTTYHVTKKDIDQGKRRNCFECPVARAIIRKHPGVEVFTAYDFIWINDQQFCTPPKVAGFIARFDDKQEVKPMKFEL